jgi:hypothetical protein
MIEKFILNETRVQVKIYILVHTMHGCNMKLALFYNLHLTKKVKQSRYTPWRRLGGEEV